MGETLARGTYLEGQEGRGFHGLNSSSRLRVHTLLKSSQQDFRQQQCQSTIGISSLHPLAIRIGVRARKAPVETFKNRKGRIVSIQPFLDSIDHSLQEELQFRLSCLPVLLGAGGMALLQVILRTL